MALSNEDKKDVKSHMGKALANKIAKVTDDSFMKRHSGVPSGVRVSKRGGINNSTKGEAGIPQKKKRKQADWHDIYQSNPGMTKREALLSAASIRDHNRQNPDDKL